MENKVIRLAVIDDDPGDITLLRRNLSKIQDLEFTLDEFTESDDCLESWKWQAFDILFLDYLLAQRTGLDVLDRIRNLGDSRPVIIITGEEDEQIAKLLLNSGANECLKKLDATPKVLERCIKNAMQGDSRTQSCAVDETDDSTPAERGPRPW